MRGPIDFHVRIRGNEFAVGTVQHEQEAVLVGLDHHLPRFATNLELSEHMFIGTIHVVHVVRRILKITNNLSGLRADRKHTRREEAVQSPARLGIVWLRIARAPVDQVEFRII